MSDNEVPEEVVIGYTEDPPVAYDEEKDPDKFWHPDLFDHALPSQKGLLTDLVYFMRGMEVPTLFTIWSGLWMLSTIVKREAWLKWFPRDLYSNLYIILAGPAGSKKSTTIDDIGVPLAEDMIKYIADPNIRGMKNINIAKDKMTPEALLDSMLPGNKPGKSSFVFTDSEGNAILDPNGRPIRYKATSEIGIVLSEMSSSIGKKSYTEGFTEILLDLYNPKDVWNWRTKGQGIKKLQRTFISFIAATTPMAFKDSIPKVASGDGFLSRCVVVYQARTNRRFSMPRPVPNGPTLEELAKRVAWIAERGLGEYKLSTEAFELYDQWYGIHKDYLEKNVSEGGIRGRMDLNLLKVALLLRIQRYDIDPLNVITIEDLQDAISLITITYGMSTELLGELGDDLVKGANTVKRILEKYNAVKRVDMLRRSKIQVSDFDQIIDYLVQTGVLTIMYDGKERKYPSRNSDELYIYNVHVEEVFNEQEERWEAERKYTSKNKEKLTQESGQAVNI